MTILAIGTRGDVQPAIAVGKALQGRGHHVRLLAGANFADWIRSHGLEAAPSAVDMQALMEGPLGQEWMHSGQHPIRQGRLMKRLVSEMAPDMLRDCWAACQDAEAIVSSFTTDVAATALVEKTGARHISMWLQPSLIATRDGRVLNDGPRPDRLSWLNWLFTKLIIEGFTWSMQGAHVNRFRREALGLPPQSRRENLAAQERALVLHGYSRHVAPRAVDWPANRHVTGYWFLNEGGDWQPPAGLEDFLAAGPPPVAIGFGSATGRDAAAFS
ncbi:MAG TPA: glycosyltransferase, partial [Herpetosiphonaceae bacterium]